MTSQLLLSLLVICVVGVSSEQCTVLQQYPHSYPLGKSKVEGIHIISRNNVSLNECLTLCCDEGPTLCQHIWLFEGRCVGMPCLTNKTACSPQVVDRLPSTIIAVKYKNIESGDQTTPEPSGVVQPVYNELLNALINSTLHNHTGTTINVTTVSHSLSTATSSSSAYNSSSSLSSSSSSSSSSHHDKVTSYPVIVMTPVASAVETSSSMASPTPTSGHTSQVITVATDAINKSKEITLPTNNVKIFASTWPGLSEDVKYSWQWSQVFGPSKGFLSVIGDKEASLTGLVEGVYVIKVSVTGDDGSYGETCVNVTVHSAPRVNTPPQPVITPSNQLLLHLPTDSAILEATSSTDDYKANEMTYKWEEISGPLETRMHPSFEQVLYLKNLVAGTYIIKLTATDVDGASNYTTANITVLPSVDNPPIANAGSAKKLVWPHNHVILYGNGSFDDNGITSYKWQKSVGPIVDMQGSSTAILELNDLQIGDYVFTLTVTDGNNQQSTAEVSVAVVEEANKPPVANAGENKEVKWPADSVLLDGSSSNDDQDITGYCWILVKPIGGDIVIESPHEVRTNVTQLRVRGKSPTVYEFNLTVSDQHNLTSWDTVLVTVTKDATIPPTIIVQSLVVVCLPQHLVILNASQSHDDFGITSYQWIPYPQNSVIGEMVTGSEDQSSVLFFTNFIEGVYLFNLTVHNKYNAWSSVVINVTVLPDVHEKNLVQLYLTDDVSTTLTLAKLNLLREMIRNELGVDSKVIIQDTRQLLPKTVVEFYVINTANDDKPYLASYVVKKLDESSVFRKLNAEFSIMGIETKVCQANCSGHGTCDYYSKTCKCKPGWMANPFRSVHGKKGLNCDWSVLYFVLILLAPVLLAAILVWFICCCCYRKQKHAVSSRRVRYALLPEDSSNGKSSRHTMNSSSIMVSETETEDEVLFDEKSKKKINNLTKYGPNAQLINPAKLQ